MYRISIISYYSKVKFLACNTTFWVSCPTLTIGSIIIIKILCGKSHWECLNKYLKWFEIKKNIQRFYVVSLCLLSIWMACITVKTIINDHNKKYNFEQWLFKFVFANILKVAFTSLYFVILRK